MAVTFSVAYGIAQLTAYETKTVDIGAPPAGAQMLVVFATTRGNNTASPQLPSTTGTTYGGLAVTYMGDTPYQRDMMARVYLLQDFTGRSGSDLVMDGAPLATNRGAMWVLGDGTIEYVEMQTAGPVGNPISVTHDPGAYPNYGTCGIYINRDYYVSWGTLGGSPTVPTAVEVRWTEDVGTGKRANFQMAKCEDQSTGGTFTHTHDASNNNSLASLLFGELPAGAVWTTPADTVQMDASPTLEFLMPASAASNMHFEIQIDIVDTYPSPTILKSHSDLAGWEFWDGDSWEPVPQAGVPNTYCGNEARYTVQSPLADGTYYRRVRAGVI